MSVALMEYLSVIWCSIYLFSIFLNKKPVSKKVIVLIPCTVIMTSIATLFTHNLIVPLNLIIIFLLLLLYNSVLYKKDINTTIRISFISFGISYVSYHLSFFICIPIAYILFINIKNLTVLNITAASVIVVIQFIILFFVFKIKRFKNGILNFERRIDQGINILISFLILLVTSVLYSANHNYELYSTIASVISIFACAILMYFFWRKHIKNLYMEKIHNRETEILNCTVNEQKTLIDKLTAENERLSEIIHRDNKMIPAMELAVEEILTCDSTTEQKEKSKKLISQLRCMSGERKNIITDYENTEEQLPSTGISSLDASIKYLFLRAKNQDISFKLSIVTDISKLTNDIISENDLNTLILDLGENAIIACSDIENKNILVVFGTENSNYYISIFDSGPNFDQKVIKNMGKIRITTHKDSGGSGIGLMTTLETLRRYQASFIINQDLDNDDFTKSVTVCFDEQNQVKA